MSIDRATLVGSGAPKVTWNSGEFWTRDDVVIPIAHSLTEQRSSMFGTVTKTRGGRVITVKLPLFGLWGQAVKLFPTAITNPTIGGRLFGTTDLPLVLHAKNGDKLTVHNMMLTGLANLKLAANAQVFSSEATFTGLIKNNGDPEDLNAYYTYSNATYAEGTFALSTLATRRWTGIWGARTGFTSIQTEAGWTVDWSVKMSPDPVDGLGPVDMFIDDFSGKASCIPVGPTFAQIEANQFFQGISGSAIGAGIHESVDALVLTDETNAISLNGAALVETGLSFSPSKKRIGNTVWETTRGFTAGAPAAIAALVAAP